MAQASSRSPDDTELLNMAIESWLSDLHTCMPGRVDSYNAATQMATIKPLIKRRIVHGDGSELLEELPPITNVPIVFARTAGFFISFPIAKGDLVTLHFCEKSIDNYMSGTGEDTDPDEFRRHDLSDAIAVPGFYPFKRSIRDISSVNLVIGRDDGGAQIHITPDGIVKIGSDLSVDFAVKGTTYRAAEDTMLSALATAFTALAAEGTLGASAAATAAATTAITTFQAAAATYLAQRVKVD